jgi:uncharacterized protein with PIN domain
MLGRLARYLRFVGCDTVYVRGLTDAEIVESARAQGRVLVTRDRQLAQRADRALLLQSPYLEDQWRAVRAAYPELPSEPSFARCTECNGRLERLADPKPDLPASGIPWDRVRAGLPLYQCTQCSHLYWEGTHSASVRRRIRSWSEGEARG